MPAEPHRPLSGASLGLGTETCEPDTGDQAPLTQIFDVPESERYVDGGLLGRGGMGEVRATTDRRLGRVVALKHPQRSDGRAEQRLSEEAALTARLMHPGIVPIHDAGRRPDGRPFYTMPVVSGRSLQEAAQGLKLPERLRLLRHFLDACEAVAYAHSEGVLHRDLKPANIMVGRFGETLVMDWGLATSSGKHEESGGKSVAGTPGYMSPEQRRGEALGPTADVYALGATLYELLAGRAPGEHPLPLRVMAPGAPADLITIAERALQADPGRRYPDARALAEDVAAWFEGRRVSAHRYTVAELLGRAWSANRSAILAILLALLSVAGATWLSYRRVLVERDRAIDAERSALDAAARSDLSLAQAEIAQALQASANGERAEAEILAAGALAHGESAAARGVLAGFDDRSRPELVARTAVPRCDRAAISVDGSRIACAHAGVITVTEPGLKPRVIARIPAAALEIVFLGAGDKLAVHLGDNTIEVHDLTGHADTITVPANSESTLRSSAYATKLLWLGRGRPTMIDLVTGARESVEICLGDRGVVAEVDIDAQGLILAACNTGALVSTSVGDPSRYTPITLLDPALGPPVSLALNTSDSTQAAVGLVRGKVQIVNTQTGQVTARLGEDGDSPIEIALDGRLLAVSHSKGGVVVWDTVNGNVMARIPSAMARVRWLKGSNTLRVFSNVVEDWEMPARAPWPHLRSSTGGVSALAISPDGTRVASAHGDGSVRITRLDREPAERIDQLSESVVKDVDFSPDGRWVIAVASREDAIFLIPVGSDAPVQRLPAISGRRVTWLADGRLVLAPYHGGLEVWPDFLGDPHHEHLDLGGGRIGDWRPYPDKTGLVMADSDGAIWRLEKDLVRVGLMPDLRALASDGRHLLLAHPRSVDILHGSTRRTISTDLLSTTRVEVSPDGSRFAIGGMDGSITLWKTSTGTRIAVMSGHVGRIGAMVFDPTGAWLITGGWDGSLRAWCTRAMDGTPAELQARTEADWGRTAEELLAARVSDGRSGSW